MAPPRITQDACQETIKAFLAANGCIADAARRLGITRATLLHRLTRAREYGLEVPDRPKPEKPAAPPDFEQTKQALRVEALQRKLREVEAENRRLKEEVLGVERAKEVIYGCQQVAPKPPKWLAPSRASGGITGVPLLLASDWHWDEYVDPRQVNFVNAFNRQIAIRRAERLFVTTVNLLINHMAKPRYEYFVLALGGDFVSGYIHDELRETNEAPLTETLLSLQDHLIAGIDLLLQHFGKLYVPGVVGNHGRLDKKPRSKGRAHENVEWLLYHMVARHYQGDDRIHFEIADGADLLFTVYAVRYLLTHGDQFRGGSGISGALAPLMLGDHRKRKQRMAVNQPYDYMLMGHWHQLLRFKGVRVNGSLKGFDEHALVSGYEFELPQQALWVTHPEHAITVDWPVFLEKPGTVFQSDGRERCHVVA